MVVPEKTCLRCAGLNHENQVFSYLSPVLCVEQHAGRCEGSHWTGMLLASQVLAGELIIGPSWQDLLAARHRHIVVGRFWQDYQVRGSLPVCSILAGRVKDPEACMLRYADLASLWWLTAPAEMSCSCPSGLTWCWVPCVSSCCTPPGPAPPHPTPGTLHTTSHCCKARQLPAYVEA